MPWKPEPILMLPPNDPAYAYIEDVVDAGIMDGESDTEFGIDEEVTRGEVLTYIYRLMKSPQSAEGSLSSFEDIEGTDYETAVIWADSIGLFDGLDEDFFVDGLFHGDEGITREQLASLLMNLAQSQLNINVQENTLESLADISDNGDIKDTYIDAVKWAIGNQLLNTNQEQKFSPGNIVTKENIAEALSKLAAMVEDETIDLAIGSEAENSESASSGIIQIRETLLVLQVIQAMVVVTIATRTLLLRNQLLRSQLLRSQLLRSQLMYIIG